MTTKPVASPSEPGAIIQFPDVPPEEVTGYHHVNFPGYPGALSLHFGNPETTVILSEIAAALMPTRDRRGVRYPDLLIAFNANPAAIIPRNGYLIPEQGKPPDFVLEVASESTGDIDEDEKRLDYARMRVPEYWRFDPSGGDWHSSHLVGDRLVGEEYQPIAITRLDDEHDWGHSEALNLDLGWEEQTKYRVDPGFYQADVNFLVNLDTWDALDEAQRTVLERGAAWIEAANADNILLNAAEIRKQAEAGIETITFDDSDTKHWLEVAQTEGWAAVAEIDPGIAAALKACLLN